MMTRSHSGPTHVGLKKHLSTVKGAAVLLCPLLLALQGCTDPRAANATNFKIAFNDYIEKTAPNSKRLCHSLRNYDADDSKIEWTQVFRDDDDPATAKFYDILASAGVFDAPTKQPNSGFFSGTKYTYPLTEEGKALVVQSEGRTLFGGRAPAYSLCVGRLSLDEVVRWTEPADQMGVVASGVTYRVQYQDLPAWARDPKIIELAPTFGEQAAGPFEAELLAVLTSDGWRIEQF